MSYCFISFSTKDRIFADKILNELENKYKIKCFICYRDLFGGISYAEQLEEAIKNSSCIILLHSINSDASEHVKREIEIAAKHNKIIVPCKLDSTVLEGELSYVLDRLHWLDLSELNDNLIGQLAQSVLKIVGYPYKKAVVKLNNMLLRAASSGVTGELLQDIVYAVHDCLKVNPGKNKRRLELLYNSYVNELVTIVNKYNGDVANHHDNLMVIMNDLLDFCRTALKT